MPAGYAGLFVPDKIFNDEEKKLVMDVANNILKAALTLKPLQKAELIDRLLSALDKPDRKIDELWAKEADDRIDAYDQGKIKDIPLEKVLEKYKWG